MGYLPVPEHMIVWSEEQVALGRAASVGTYLAQLIAEDRTRQEAIVQRQVAMAEGRDSGVSMRDPDVILKSLLEAAPSPQKLALNRAIREGRESGWSMASMDGILARAMARVAA